MLDEMVGPILRALETMADEPRVEAGQWMGGRFEWRLTYKAHSGRQFFARARSLEDLLREALTLARKQAARGAAEARVGDQEPWDAAIRALDIAILQFTNETE